MDALKEPGVYFITSVARPNKYYIGSTVNVFARERAHRGSLRIGNHHSSHLQNHYNKYGAEDLSFHVICYCDLDDIRSIEQSFLDLSDWAFNMRDEAVGSAKGSKRSKKACENMSKARKGLDYHRVYKVTDEHKRNLSKASKGIKKSPEHIANMPTKFPKGKVYTQEEKDVLKKAQLKRWERDKDKIRAMRLKGWETRRKNMKAKEEAQL